jgi:hypothetical protein
LPAGSALMRYGHFVIVIIISAGPLILTIPNALRIALAVGDNQRPVWPPYWPSLLSKTLHDATEEDDIIFSDQPWAVAWYADRTSIWLPRKVEEFESLELLAENQKLETAGILMTPTSFEDNPLYSAAPFGANEEFAALMLDGAASGVTEGQLGSGGLRMRTPVLSKVMADYPEIKHLFPMRVIYYSKKRILQQQR